jgi:hypothetical protein
MLKVTHNPFKLSVVMLSVLMLSVVMLNITVVSVVAAYDKLVRLHFNLRQKYGTLQISKNF